MTNERRTRRTKPWEELTFADNFLFCKILENDPELCRQLLELLLRIKIGRLEPPQSERTMQETPEAKAVRFDVYTKDGSRIFDIEMQTTDAKNLPERARYYQSIIDMDSLSRGENYVRLKDSYVIFLCLRDVFGRGLPMYFFENVCRDDKTVKLGDRTYKVFFNAANCDRLDDSKARDFFRYLRGDRADTALSKRIAQKVAFAKRNMSWRRQYMTWQQTIDEAKELSFEEGVRQTVLENARNLINMNILTPAQISQAVSLPLEKVLALKEEISCEPIAR